MSTVDKQLPDAGPRLSWRRSLPFVVFMGLAALFFFGLQRGDPSTLPSVLIGKKAPEFSLPPLAGLMEKGLQVPGFSNKDLAQGKVSIVNIWASWCVPCRAEHPLLIKLTRLSGAPLYGLNIKDGTESARRFLGQLGNPFTAVGVDKKGRTAIDWGAYGVPETFIVGGDGTILYKQVGPISNEIIQKHILPVIEKARAGV